MLNFDNFDSRRVFVLPRCFAFFTFFSREIRTRRTAGATGIKMNPPSGSPKTHQKKKACIYKQRRESRQLLLPQAVWRKVKGPYWNSFTRDKSSSRRTKVLMPPHLVEQLLSARKVLGSLRNKYTQRSVRKLLFGCRRSV